MSPLPPPASPWSVAQSATTPANSPPILVATAPSGIAGFLANPAELSRPRNDSSFLPERDLILSQWRRLHNLHCSSTITVNIAGSVYHFPRAAVFLLNPAQTNSPPTPLLRHTAPHAPAPQITPTQLFQELHLQEFGSSSSVSPAKPTLLDSLSSGFAMSALQSLHESLSSQANSLSTTSVSWKPKKRGRTQIFPPHPEDQDQDYARPFSLESLPLHVSANLDALLHQDILVDVDPSAMDTDLPSDDPAHAMADHEELTIDDADVFDDRVADDALVEAWDFTTTKKSSAQIASMDPVYMTPGNVFSPGIDLPRTDLLTGYGTPNALEARMVTTPAGPVASLTAISSAPSSASKNNEELVDEDASSEADSDTSSHLSFSEEEAAIAATVWNSSVTTSLQPFADICPSAYKPLALPKPELPADLHLMEIGVDSHTAAELGLNNDDAGLATDDQQGMMVMDDMDQDEDSEDGQDSDSDDTNTTAAQESFRPSNTGNSSSNAHTHWTLDVAQEEPSALFTGSSASPNSFTPRAFAITAWARLAQYSGGDSAKLCFISHLCNFFETTTGALISDYWPLLYNSEVVFKASPTHQSALLLGGSGHVYPGHSHTITRNDAIVSAKNEVVLSESLDREAFNIHSPIQGFGDLTWRAQSELSADVFRMYLKLDETRLALWNQSGGSSSAPGTPHTAMPAITPNTILTADDIFAAEWSSNSGTQIGPLSTEDWLNGRNLGLEQTSSRKPQFTSKWSGSYECSGSSLSASSSSPVSFTWPLEQSMRHVESMYLLSQLSTEVFGGACLGSGTTITGPLPLDRYQNLLCGPSSASGASSSSASADHSHTHHAHSHSRPHDSNEPKDMIEVLPDPIAVVRYGEEGAMELPLTALYAWEKLNLRPLSPPKDVTYYVLAPSHIASGAVPFFKQLSAVYSQCNLGSHTYEPFLADSAGIIPIIFPSGLDEFNRHVSATQSSAQAATQNMPDLAASGATAPSTPMNPLASSTPNPFSHPATNSANIASAAASTADSNKFAWGSTVYPNSNPQQATLSPFALTESQLAAYEEWAVKLAERLATSRQYNKSIIIYVVSPFTLESSTPIYAGDARSTNGAGASGLTRAQQLLAQRSAISLLHTVWAAVRKSNVRNLIVHGVSQNRVTSPNFHIAQLKEVAFNVYTKCRRVLLGEASRDQREPPKLYEPLFVLGTPSPKDPFAGNTVPSTVPHKDRDFTLHVAYVVTSRTLTWSMCDGIGEILECSTLPAYSTITLALVKLLEKVMQQVVNVGQKWKVVIGKFGMLSPGEVTEWHQAVKDYFASKPNSHLVSQVSLVSFQLSHSLDVFPSNSLETSAQSQSDARYIASMYGNLDPGSNGSSNAPAGLTASTAISNPVHQGPRTIAVYDTKPDTDHWDSDLLAQSHMLTLNPQWQHASAWSTESQNPLTTSLYNIFTISQSGAPGGPTGATANKTVTQVDSSGDSSLILATIRHITLQYHQLSWLNISPVSINRVDVLPLHFRLVRKLSNLVLIQSQQ